MPRDHEAASGGELATQANPIGGFLTKKREVRLSPAALSEQQRAKSEIEAALTIAAARPRDERAAMDAILVSCQRPGLAEKSQYNYSRGGTDIVGASIVLLEAIAQRWGNLSFSFRELARFPGSGGQPGESIVEAFAWDLQSNTRRNVQFTVSHAIKSHGKTKVLTDDRDIYELVANYAQRRVRTCLQAVIPRDVVDAACEECDKTMKTSITDIPAATAKLLDAFAALKVTREMIEGRIQRRIDAITHGQIIGLRKVYTSLKDGMSEPADWFNVAPAGDSGQVVQTAAEKAKAAMRKNQAAAPPKPQPAASPKVDAAAAAAEEAGQPAEDPNAWEANRDESEADPPFDPPTEEDLSQFPEQSWGDGVDEPAAEEPEVQAEPEVESEPEPAPPAPSAEDVALAQVKTWLEDIRKVATIRGLTNALNAIPKTWPDHHKKTVADAIQARIRTIQTANKPNVV